MLYFSLTGDAAFGLLALPGWERERISDALLLLTTDPRPPFAQRPVHVAGEAFEIWIGERRIHYRVYKDDWGDDAGVVAFRVV